VAGAAVFVAATGGVARWFPVEERAFGQSTFLGVGGAAGETTAFFVLPLLAVYFASGWRPAMTIVAAVVGVIGVLCAIFFRSAPPAASPRKARIDASLLADSRLWTCTFLFCGFILAARIAQQWIAVYAADVYLDRGMSAERAVVRGGLLAVVMFSLCGRGIGGPIVGRLSDAALRRGISRAAMAIAWLVVLVALLFGLAGGVRTPWVVGTIACALSVAINTFPLISALVADIYGPERTASILGFVNMVAQLVGATVLAGSGYAGMSLAGHSGGSLAEYRGIWLSAALGVALMLALGLVMHRASAAQGRARRILRT
jgi:MFS family permease